MLLFPKKYQPKVGAELTGLVDKLNPVTPELGTVDVLNVLRLN